MAEPLSVGQLGSVLRRFWILICATTLLGGLTAFVITQFLTPTYTATATQLIKGIPGTGVAANYEAAQYAVSRAKSYPSFIDSQVVLDGVRTDMRNRFSLIDLRRNLSATNPPDTPLLLITATANTREDARDLANSAARQMARFITQIETVAGKSPIAVETAVQASLPIEPTSPRRLLLTAVGALVGFVVGAAIALVAAYGGQTRRRRPAPVKAAPVWADAAESRSGLPTATTSDAELASTSADSGDPGGPALPNEESGGSSARPVGERPATVRVDT